MTETDGIVERPADVIGQLEYEINRGGNSARINAMIAARDALREVTKEKNRLDRLAKEYFDKLNGYISATLELDETIKTLTARAERAERDLGDAVAKEREECAKIADQNKWDDAEFLTDFGKGYRASAIDISDALRARSNTMTDTAPVTAWAVVDKDGKYDSDVDILSSPKYALLLLDLRDSKRSHRAPHRVVRVEIKVVGEG